MGIIMLLNVWGAIWRNQRVVLANAANVLAGGTRLIRQGLIAGGSTAATIVRLRVRRVRGRVEFSQKNPITPPD